MQGVARSSPPAPRLGVATPACILSNGSYVALVTGRGTGFARFGAEALTPWSGDPLTDADGFAVHVRDVQSGGAWSFGPGSRDGDGSGRWQPGVFEIERDGDDLVARLEIAVPPDAPVEIRRLVLHNRGAVRRRLQLTTAVEVVLHDARAHASHPAFSKLFVQTEVVPAQRLLLARRRPRAPDERHPCMAHAHIGAGTLQWETDRTRFVGRGRPAGSPRALAGQRPLSGTTGNVLDPILALRCEVDLEPGASATSAFWLGAPADGADAARLARRFAAPGAVDAAFVAARAAATDLLDRLGLDAADAAAYQGLAAAMLYGDRGLRADAAVLRRAAGRRADLARHGVAPERAFAVLHAERPAGARLLPTLLAAHRYWRALGLPLDLVVLRDAPATAATGDPDAPLVVSHGNLSAGEIDLLDALARLVVVDAIPRPARDALAADVAPAAAPQRPVVRRAAAADGEATPRPSAGATLAADAPEGLRFENGRGGFAAAGDEYVVRVTPHADGGLDVPPCPWVDVIANEEFGCLVSETGAGTTWSGNSREHRLTPWSNDPLLDPHGEALWVRDEATGAYWSAWPGPTPGDAPYEVRHGFGHSVCRHTGGDLLHEVETFVPRDAPYKATVVRLTNRGTGARRLSLWSYARLVLGDTPEESGRHVQTEFDAAHDLLAARNLLADDFATRVAFAAIVPSPEGAAEWSCDRAAFLGRDGDVAHPAAIASGAPLTALAGAGLDACFVLRLRLEIPAGATREVAFLLGDAPSHADARQLVAAARAPQALRRALQRVGDFWREGLGGLRITTPSPALDLMVNGWLPYQNLACRMWGRTAFYQSGGAFGFRDQLQDAAALVHLWPERTRAQILLHAAHQFVDGDVLHWWHAPGGRGIRTRFADDLLWLPLVAATYVRTTGDWAVLDVVQRFLVARPLADGEDEAFLAPEDSGTSASVYEHCCRAIERAAARGPHGLPLFGTGDWNDGMNRVGREGRGESVWMAFFLVHLVDAFVPLCERRGDSARVRRLRADRDALVAAANDAGWDGAWYRRGYYDDGAPLGSAGGDECRIDALAQAWAVISGVAPAARAEQALDALEAHLISEPEGIVRLLTPPFENTPHDPGYIKGYLPGVRENGGQYTHAALWVVRALAEAGRRDRAACILDLLNPVHHAWSPDSVARYQVEPYVVAADVYGAAPHVGRGGWTWYTGSAGWMWRVAVETILGFAVVEGEALRLAPRIPDDWPEATLEYRVPGGATRYVIRIVNPRGDAASVAAATLDGAPARRDDGAVLVPLVRDDGLHRVEIVMGPATGGGA